MFCICKRFLRFFRTFLIFLYFSIIRFFLIYSLLQICAFAHKKRGVCQF